MIIPDWKRFDQRVTEVYNSVAPEIECAALVILYERLESAHKACLAVFGKETSQESVMLFFSRLCDAADRVP